jgi:hypothetical protein
MGLVNYSGWWVRNPGLGLEPDKSLGEWDDGLKRMSQSTPWSMFRKVEAGFPKRTC